MSRQALFILLVLICVSQAASARPSSDDVPSDELTKSEQLVSDGICTDQISVIDTNSILIHIYSDYTSILNEINETTTYNLPLRSWGNRPGDNSFNILAYSHLVKERAPEVLRALAHVMNNIDYQVHNSQDSNVDINQDSLKSDMESLLVEYKKLGKSIRNIDESQDLDYADLYRDLIVLSKYYEPFVILGFDNESVCDSGSSSDFPVTTRKRFCISDEQSGLQQLLQGPGSTDKSVTYILDEYRVNVSISSSISVPDIEEGDLSRVCNRELVDVLNLVSVLEHNKPPRHQYKTTNGDLINLTYNYIYQEPSLLSKRQKTKLAARIKRKLVSPNYQFPELLDNIFYDSHFGADWKLHYLDAQIFSVLSSD